jgi:predicted TIM-barrel fold metal-dependent hydrolase
VEVTFVIVDCHHHIGEQTGPDLVFEWSESVADILKAMDEHGVDITILQPLGGASDPRRVHDQIAELSVRYPGRIFGICSVNPRLFGPEGTYREIERCVRQLGFVGIKHHSLAFALDPMSATADPIWQAACDLGVPVMCCTGPFALPFTDPANLIGRIRQFPQVPVILAHGCDYSTWRAALNVAGLSPNVYIDSSLSLGIYLRRAIDALGADRVLLACEHSTNVGPELAKVRALKLAPEDERKVLGLNSVRLFRLSLPG